MDLQEWELIYDDDFLEIHDNNGGKQTCSTNYFICPPKSISDSADKTGPPEVPNQLIPVPVVIGSITPKLQDAELAKNEAVNLPTEQKTTPPEVSEKIVSFDTRALGANQDPVSQVFFKKTKDTESIEMKVDSPKSNSARGVVPQTEGAGVFQFEERGEPRVEFGDDSEIVMGRDNVEPEMEESDGEGLNNRKWSLTGIGAICSVGVAVVTLCIVIFNSHRKSYQVSSAEEKASI